MVGQPDGIKRGLGTFPTLHAEKVHGVCLRDSMKNMAIVGGSLAFVAFGAGAYSLDGRKT